MESYNWIESGIIFGLGSIEAIKKVKFGKKHFSIHGEAFEFVVDYNTQYNSFPTTSALIEKFPELDKEAKDSNFDYCLDVFRKQVIYRQAVQSIKNQERNLAENPEEAVSKIVNGLESIDFLYDGDDVSIYDSGDLGRLEKYRKRREMRRKGFQILGVPTVFSSINATGVGWLPGDLISVYARPSVGKTWFLIKCAAVAAQHNYKVLFITVEMPKEKIFLRMDVVVAKMNGFEFSHSALMSGNDIDEEAYSKFLSENSSRRLIAYDNIEQSVLNLSTLKTIIKKTNPKVLIIDGIHFFESDRKDAVWEKMQVLFGGIKKLCTANRLVAIVSTQANRSAANFFMPPKISEVAFGDALIQYSDVAMGMCKFEDDDKKRIVQFQKFRDMDDKKVEYSSLYWDVDKGDIREINEN